MTLPRITALWAIGSLALTLAASAAPFQEANVQRWGADYRRFDIAAGGADVCAEACAKDSQCRAWTYAKPGAFGPKAQCSLKSDIPNGSSNPCCISGVAAGASIGLALAAPDERHNNIAAAKVPSGIAGATKADARINALEMPIENEAPQAPSALPKAAVPAAPASAN